MDKLDIAREALRAIANGYRSEVNYLTKYNIEIPNGPGMNVEQIIAVAKHGFGMSEIDFDPREYAGTDPGPDSSKLWDVYMMTHVISEDRSPLALLEGFWHWLDGNGKLK